MADCKVNYSPTNYLTQEPVTVWNGQSSEQYTGNNTWSFATTGAPIPDGGTYSADKFQWLHSSYEKTITVGTAVLGIDDRIIDFNNVQYKFDLTAGTYKLIFEAIDPTGTWYSDRLTRYPSSSGYYGTPQYALRSSSGAVLNTVNFDRTKYQGQTFIHEEHEFTLATDRTIGLYFRGMGHADSTINGFMPRFMIVPTNTTAKKFDVTSNNVNYSGYSCWSGLYHSLRKLTTATEAVENPLYSDGTAITSYTLKGNEEHTGTPSPSNPVMPNGVGERTEQLIPEFLRGSASTSGVNFEQIDSMTIRAYGELSSYVQQVSQISFKLSAGTYYLWLYSTNSDTKFYPQIRSVDGQTTYRTGNGSFTLTEDTVVVPRFVGSSSTATIIDENIKLMLNVGSQPLPFEPYGYKIPISTLQGSAVNYLGSVQSTRQIHKLVLTGDEAWVLSGDIVYISSNYFPDLPVLGGSPLYCTHFPNDSTGMINGGSWWLQTKFADVASDVPTWKTWLQQQYAAGTPVTVWYVLATEETGIVNEPLMAIGTYADSISNAVSIPTTDGANSITVDTTVQPSEFTATWSGWHNAEVKEKSENLFDKDNAERYEYGLGQDNTVGFANHAAMFCFEAEPNTNYSAKVYGTANTFLRLYRSNNVLIKPERNGIEYDSMVEQSSTQYPEVTINSGNCQYIWLQVSGSWYDTYGGDTIMLNTGSTALPYEPYWQ